MPDLLTRTFERAFAVKAPTPAQPARRLSSGGQSEKYNIPDPTRADRQAVLYSNLTWLQIAIGHVAQAVASTPFSVSTRTTDGLSAIEDHPFELRLQDPNPDQDQFEFLYATVAWHAIAGNCYWWLNRVGETAEIDELWVIPASQIQPVPDGSLSIRGYLYDAGYDIPMPLRPWEVVHFKTFNPINRYVGLSGEQALAIDATGDIAAQTYNANFYGKDNAKASGILAFADYIEEGAWKRIEADWKEQHGGTKNNRVMRLRGAGAGGVEWLQTQLSQADIQYLEQRRFTMEEVYARFAPGLASILAINATEANSTAGKDTFWSMAVYPVTYAMGRKITQRILPSYGEGLVGAFEDVRRSDTLIELQEQQEYSKTHTVEEIRQKYYQDKPLGDGRDKLLPAEIGTGLTDARPPEEKAKQATEIMQGRAQLPQGEDEEKQPPFPPPSSGKALDRKRWYTKAERALRATGNADVPFDPDYLTDGEAMQIRAALKKAITPDDVWRVLA